MIVDDDYLVHIWIVNDGMYNRRMGKICNVFTGVCPSTRRGGGLGTKVGTSPDQVRTEGGRVPQVR